MSLIMRMLGVSPTRNPDDERWWGGAAETAVAGITVNADTALKLDTAWACVGLLAETIAALPLVINQWTGNDARQRARNHPLYGVLHDQANDWQTAAEFRDMMTGHVLLRGNAYAEIRPGPRGAVDQLIPLHPDRVTVERLANGRLRYQVLQDDGQKRPYNQEDIFRLQGRSSDGLVGMSVIEYARDSLGLGLATERYGSKFFRNDSRPGGALRTDGKLSPDAAARLKASWEQAHSGDNQHRVAILEQGLQWQAIGIAPNDAQFLESREFNAESVCRWFRVPPHMVGLTSKATSWGSGIEQMSIGFVTYTLLPWLIRWTQAISRDLILAPQTYFAEFIVEGLLRGDITSRYQAYATGRQWGWLSVNDIRRLENMNPVDNGDVYLQPLNMQEAGSSMSADTTEINTTDGNSMVNGAKIRNVDLGENADPKATLNGAQISSLLDIVNQVALGQLTNDTAVEVMVASFPFDEDRARQILKDIRPIVNNNDAPAAGHYRLLAEEAAGRVVRKEMAAMNRAASRAADTGDWAAAVDEFYRDHAEFVAQTMRMPLVVAASYVEAGVQELLRDGPAAMDNWPINRVGELVELATRSADYV